MFIEKFEECQHGRQWPTQAAYDFQRCNCKGDDMTMPDHVREAIEAVIKALDVPRNRMGKLDGDCVAYEPLRVLAVRYNVPGARDSAEQAVHVLRAVLSTNMKETIR